MKEKNLKESVVLKRIGFNNLSKGTRRFKAFMEGDMSNSFLINNLHKGVGADISEIRKMADKTREEIQQAIEEEVLRRQAEERQNFVPYLYVKIEREIPSPIFAYAIMGFGRLRRIILPGNFNCLAEIEKGELIKKKINKRQNAYEGNIPTLGRIRYYILREVYDDEVKKRKVYDITGTPALGEGFEDKSMDNGHAALSVNGQSLDNIIKSLHVLEKAGEDTESFIH
ncbi:MAG: hypothetical protein JXK07_11100 [Spirochaetes bacterium]|nr:hypothetical protein [Spirochaetota bacterium]MBN2772398.1 hypothetical protein [Spirochaetota bacterium]